MIQLFSIILHQVSSGVKEKSPTIGGIFLLVQSKLSPDEGKL